MKPTTIITAVAVTALLIGTSAFASDNAAHLSQKGDRNAALIDQSAGSGNRVGTGALAARQNGNDNILQFTQSGERNAIGGSGFLQQSNRSVAIITQSSNRNIVREVAQTGIASYTGTNLRNTLSIIQQGGNGNRIDAIFQTRTGVLPRQPGNEASILQDGAGNRITLLSQTGRVNSADLSFDGDWNHASSAQWGGGNSVAAQVKGNLNLIRVEQQSLALGNEARIGIDGNGNTVSVGQTGANAARIAIDGNYNRVAAIQSGIGNTIDITIHGHGNNALPFFSRGEHRGLAAGAQLAPGDIVQNGLLNSIDYRLGDDALSSANRFAVAQDGTGNRIEGTTDGIGNEVVVVQDGALNFTSFVQIGNFNIIGVNQQ